MALMSRIGFKFVRKDGTTHNGYVWPIPTLGPPVRVEATDPTEHDDPCPHHEGDGLCVAKTASGASSGGISMAEAVGLWLEYDDADVLAESEDKVRVRGVTVTGVFDPLALARAGFCANLGYANLRDANLRDADLRDANLRDANLWGADLRDANLRGADLRGAKNVNTTGALNVDMAVS